MVRWLPSFVVALAVGWFVGERQAPGETPSPRGPAIERAVTPEQKIEKALKEPTEFNFVETPLSDVIEYIRKTYGIEVQLDKRALDELGIANETPITKKLKGISLRSALRLILRDLDMTWVIKDEVLFITTNEAADIILTVETYDVTDLAAYRDEKGEIWYDGESLVHVITDTTSPRNWDFVGGMGTCTSLVVGETVVLVVRQTQSAHEEIANVLPKMREQVRKHGDKQLPPRRDRPKAFGQNGKCPPSVGAMPAPAVNAEQPE